MAVAWDCWTPRDINDALLNKPLTTTIGSIVKRDVAWMFAAEPLEPALERVRETGTQNVSRFA